MNSPLEENLDKIARPPGCEITWIFRVVWLVDIALCTLEWVILQGTLKNNCSDKIGRDTRKIILSFTAWTGEDRHGYNRIMTPLALRLLDKPPFQRYYLFIGMSLPPGTKSRAKNKAVCQSSQIGSLAPSLSISRLERSIAILRKTEIIQFAPQQQSQNDSTWKGEGEFVFFHITYARKTCA